MWLEIIAGICLAWYSFIAVVCIIGYAQLLRHYSKAPDKSISSSRSVNDAPHVTVIRPCKGFDPYLYECLAATFQQDYPSERLTVYLCVSSRDDLAYPVLQRIVEDFPNHDARIFIERDDPALAEDGQTGQKMGPNPKIRNMSRAYSEAKGDILWVIDCNVWVGRGVCGRMVDKLCGLTSSSQKTPYKFVHHLPICVDVDNSLHGEGADNALLNGNAGCAKTSPAVSQLNQASHVGGGRLEELFLASSHAKFYTAINTVAIAPCIVGKSNMFRRSHLDQLTSRLNSGNSTLQNVGINHFSYNICEDHLIGDLLWRGDIPQMPSLGNHGLVLGDLAIQPIAGMSVKAYIARRVRWLRVRKFTVTLATLVEPGTECFLCSAYGAFAMSTLPWFRENLGLPSTWITFALVWLLSVLIWATVDWTEYVLLHSGKTIETNGEARIPAFVRPLKSTARRPVGEWLLAWLGREALALPIWIWAFYGGVTVVWRERKFWVGIDMKVHEIRDESKHANGHAEGSNRKARTD